MKRFRKTRITRKEYEMSVEMHLTPYELDARMTVPEKLTPDKRWNELQYLIWLCGAEARGETPEGIALVAHVIMNRFMMQYPYFGKTVKEVCLKHSDSGCYQFSAANPKDRNYSWAEKDGRSVWYKVAKAVLPVYFEKVGHADRRMLYYHAGTIDVPKFFKKALKPLMTVGNHIFYIDANIPDSNIDW